MSATTRVAPPTAAATGLGLRDRVRSRTRANASPGRAENASARFAVGGEPSATALRASRDDHPGRFGDDSYGYERPLEGARRRDRYGGGYDGYGGYRARIRPRSATGVVVRRRRDRLFLVFVGVLLRRRAPPRPPPRRDAADAARDAGASAHRRDRRAVRLLLGRARDRDAEARRVPAWRRRLRKRQRASRRPRGDVFPLGARRARRARATPPRAAAGTSASGGAASWRRCRARARPRPASTTAASMRPSPGC